MNRDILAAYVVMSVMVTVGVLAVFIGALRGNPDATIVGVLTGVYAAIIGTVMVGRSELKREIQEGKEEIKDVHTWSKINCCFVTVRLKVRVC